MVWCSYNKRTNHLHVYRRLLTNCLHGSAAELWLTAETSIDVPPSKNQLKQELVYFGFY